MTFANTDPAATRTKPLPLLAESSPIADYLRDDEFPEGAMEFTDEPSRRRFLTLMGASLALAGATGCNIRPASQRTIMPYAREVPAEMLPGVPLYFATAAPFAGYGQGVLVRSNDGRPTKIEGNPDHPSSLGGAGIHALASILDLYDPDRSRVPTHIGNPSSIEVAVSALRGKLFSESIPNAGVRLRLLTGTITSPTLARQITQLLSQYTDAKWVQYDAISSENVRNGVAKAFGKPLHVTYDFAKADVVVALEADFLCVGPASVRYSRDFADRRKIREDGKDRAEIDAGRKAGQPFKEGVKFDPAAKMEEALVNRLYAIECMPTNTGAVADHRLALTTTQITAFARSLAAALGVPGITPAGDWTPTQKQWLAELVKDLQGKKGRSIVIAGDHLPAWVHTLVAAINVQLENIGKTVLLSAPIEASVPGKMSDLQTLVQEMKEKKVDVLLIFGGVNPVYSAPADLDFAAALKNVPFTFHMGTHQDETAVLCEWHVPESHYLEAWGDIRGHDGTVTIQQPLIAPLYASKSPIEILSALLKSSEEGVPPTLRDPLETVKATWANFEEIQKTFPNFQKPAVFEIFWQQCVRAGVIPGTQAPADPTNKLADNWNTDIPTPAPLGGDYELNFRACPVLYDGRYANNGWLQELPKPLTKIAWDNAAFMSLETAKKFGVLTNFDWISFHEPKRGSGGQHGRAKVGVIELDVAGKKLKVPVWVLPGHADGAITVHLGHGRERAGRVGNAAGSANINTEGKQARGFNAFRLRTLSNLWTVAAKAVATNQTYVLACTQGHWAMAERDPISGELLDRKPVRHGTLADYRQNPMFAKIPPAATGETILINENIPQPVKPGEPVPSANFEPPHAHDPSHKRITPLNMYNPAEVLTPGLRDSQRRRWAMAVDLSACTGCSACVIACQSENNIPVVGKEQVNCGRLMHWINIDRYYPGTQYEPSAAATYFQPRMCVQCENAPCEVVCPVGATVHSSDGLNDMAYNRCVGTRYCSNNCPYKVRRFNFLTFQDWNTDTIKLSRNPDVSVRSRGVMEKCTFCVQRIRNAEIVAEREGRAIQDGEILTACQAACPSGAIVFGDINQPDSVVSKWKNEPHTYGLLAELNTRPRLTHMAVIRNPNPNMPKETN